MAETSAKKEKQKKKLLKRQEKEQKKEERKANSNKGKGFEDMLAYVDEFGRISSTPIDPTRKKTEIKLDDIQLGAAKVVELLPEDLIHEGVVSFYNDSKGYGFIRDNKTKESFFVHANGLLNQIKENDKVTFEIEQGPKGLIAVKVALKK